MSKTLFIAAAAITAVTGAGAAQAHTEVSLKNIAARVVVIPENRSDVDLRVVYGKAKVPVIMVHSEGSRLVADGKLGNHGVNCKVDGANVPGLGFVAMADLPTVYIRTPMDAKVSAGGATWGEVRASQSLDLGEGGCGKWTVGDVSGKAEISIGGSGDVTAGKMGDAEVNIGGSGNFYGGAAQALEANIGGNGDISLNSVDGPVEVNIGGSGNVKIDSGQSPKLEVNIAGSGDVRHGGTVRDLEVNIVGSGDVRVHAVTGNVSRSIMGSGKVIIGQ
ncbi:MAG: GIN domain-containing protein [Asticcacaulis sp.]|uniref:GIN domain-containing protein n=1 Tax=Asticcacaulis sp. TaxID=1872648 RepID=UPI003F7C263F